MRVRRALGVGVGVRRDGPRVPLSLKVKGTSYLLARKGAESVGTWLECSQKEEVGGGGTPHALKEEVRIALIKAGPIVLDKKRRDPRPSVPCK